MYIDITIDLKNYQKDTFDLRLSNYHTVKKVVDIVWQAASPATPPRDGNWVKVVNKHLILSGSDKLVDHGITSGDRLEIL